MSDTIDQTKESTNTTEDTSSKFESDSLENLRKRMLATDARNALINFKHSKTSDIRTIDIAMDDVAGSLLVADREFSFVAIEEPSEDELIDHGYLEIGKNEETIRLKADPKAEQWAKVLGYNTNYEQQATSRIKNNNQIQTLLYKKHLDATLRILKAKSETHIKETGSNILYLLFGFLEWTESNNSDRKFLSPLYFIPVAINKKKSALTESYFIKYTGEEIIANLPLTEKLRQDFGIILPDIAEKQLPLEYLTKIDQAISSYKNKKWAVKKFTSLAMCKLVTSSLMHKDLDPKNWPEGSGNLQNHEIIKQIFSGSEDADKTSKFVEEYKIDTIKKVHELYPLIDNADSSQHSALIAVLKGENLVIEGPPGSGKSQTITNLIAAALAQGKTVLFVAEKMTALEVVKDRLEQAGLGDFCLELHGKTTNKKLVYENLKQRLNKRGSFKHPNKIDLQIELYENRKDQLNTYVESINYKWKKTNKTIHQILIATTKYKQQFDNINLIDIHIEAITGTDFSETSVEIITADLKHYGATYDDMLKDIATGNLTNNPWFGVHNKNITEADHSTIKQVLASWNLSIGTIREILLELEQQLIIENISQLATIAFLVANQPQLPDFNNDVYVPALAKLTAENITATKTHLQQQQQGKQQFDELATLFNYEVFNDEDKAQQLNLAISALSKLIVNNSLTLDDISTNLDNFERFNNLSAKIYSHIEYITQNDNSLTELLPYSYNGFIALKKYSSHIAKLDKQLIARRDAIFDNSKLDETLINLETDISKISSAKIELNGLFNLTNLPVLLELEALQYILADSKWWSFIDKNWWSAKNKLRSLAATIKPNTDELIARLPKLIRYKKFINSFLAIEKSYKNLLKHEYYGLETNTNELVNLRSWYKAIRDEYGTGYYQPVRFANSLFNLDSKVFTELQQAGNDYLIDINEFISLYKQLAEIFQHKVFTDKNYIFAINELYKNIADNIKNIQSCCKHNISLEQLDNKISLQQDFLAKQLTFTENKITTELFNITLNLQDCCVTEINSINATLVYAENINKLTTEFLQNYLRQQADKTQLEQLKNNLANLKQAYNKFLAVETEFSKLVELNKHEWFNNIKDNIILLSEHNATALVNFEYLISWVNFIKLKQPLEGQGLKSLLQLLEDKKITSKQLADAYLAVAYNILAKEIINENKLIADFSSASHKNIIKQFAEYDKQLKNLQQQKIAHVIDKYSENKIVYESCGAKVATFTEMKLINHEAGKTTRHAPIRQLVERATKSLVALKPCFMMSPVSVAQYLKPGIIEFDILVMDEASQIKTEHALGAIARAKQVVIVGDPKQLPPSNYFNKNTKSENEDEETISEQLESILDVSLQMFNARRLRWHYRSRHQSLIAFSNQKFYDDNLIIFPSPAHQSKEFGIKFQYIKFGIFHDRENIEEAKIIAKAISTHLINHPEESLGVVAMNLKQQERIENEIQSLAQTNTKFRKALDENETSNSPLFIKNLESVQGDERDVIYISFTYGSHQQGSTNVHQRFGPINNKDGHRRLNVLLTRSKKRMHIFSSMQANDIKLTETSSLGVQALKSFLDYAATGKLQKHELTGREPDSDFEIEVMRELQQAGFTAVPQLGVAGFFIDLAVKDPNNPDRFILAIECDGASYHSAQSARDRDILRQSILEDRGWRVERIWSTDWYYNPKDQIKRIVKILHQLQTPEAEKSTSTTETEVEEVAKIIAQEQQIVTETKNLIEANDSLKQILEKFDAKVISIKDPDTDHNKKLLRPAMIEALVAHLPTSREEFHEDIPEYIRKGTKSSQGKFLDEVLHLIGCYISGS